MKRLSRRLCWYRIDKNNHNMILKKGETIKITNNTNNEHKIISYVGTSKNESRFLQHDDFMELVKSQYIFEKTNYENNDKDEFIKYVQQYKTSTKCQNADCKCRNIDFEHCQYDFDHLDKTDKKHEIGYLIMKYKRSATQKTKNKYKQLILEEMSKCQVLCVSCHRKKSYDERYGPHIMSQTYDCLENYMKFKNLSIEPKYVHDISILKIKS